MKRTTVTTSSNTEDEKIGIENSTLRWNQPKKAPKKKEDTKTKAAQHTAEPSDVTAVEEPEDADVEEAVFELRDINVIFPTGYLTIVTGKWLSYT